VLGSNCVTSKCITPFHSTVTGVGVPAMRFAFVGVPSFACHTSNSSLVDIDDRATTRTDVSVNAPPEDKERTEKKKKKKKKLQFREEKFRFFKRKNKYTP
jgi:hypothetical protein